MSHSGHSSLPAQSGHGGRGESNPPGRSAMGCRWAPLLLSIPGWGRPCGIGITGRDGACSFPLVGMVWPGMAPAGCWSLLGTWAWIRLLGLRLPPGSCCCVGAVGGGAYDEFLAASGGLSRPGDPLEFGTGVSGGSKPSGSSATGSPVGRVITM